jgi:hypothetical protein
VQLPTLPGGKPLDGYDTKQITHPDGSVETVHTIKDAGDGKPKRTEAQQWWDKRSVREKAAAYGAEFSQWRRNLGPRVSKAIDGLPDPLNIDKAPGMLLRKSQALGGRVMEHRSQWLAMTRDQRMEVAKTGFFTAAQRASDRAAGIRQSLSTEEGRRKAWQAGKSVAIGAGLVAGSTVLGPLPAMAYGASKAWRPIMDARGKHVQDRRAAREARVIERAGQQWKERNAGYMAWKQQQAEQPAPQSGTDAGSAQVVADKATKEVD